MINIEEKKTMPQEFLQNDHEMLYYCRSFTPASNTIAFTRFPLLKTFKMGFWYILFLLVLFDTKINSGIKIISRWRQKTICKVHVASKIRLSKIPCDFLK